MRTATKARTRPTIQRPRTPDRGSISARSGAIAPAATRRRFPPEVLSDAEVRQLMEACGRYAWTAVRHRALIALLYRGGLRIGEALGLYPKDLDFKAGSIRVLFAKGGRARTVGLDPGAFGVLRMWLDARARLGIDDDSPIFCSRSGSHLTASFIRNLLPRLAKVAGIRKRVHAHGLRHTHAAQLRAEGIDIAIISRQLGHTNLLTTIRYLDHLAPEAVVKAIAARAWSA